MSKEEFKEKLNNVLDFDFKKNEPKYAGDSSPLEDIIEIQKEYIASLEKEVEKYENMTSQEAYEFFIDKWCKELKNVQ